MKLHLVSSTGKVYIWIKYMWLLRQPGKYRWLLNRECKLAEDYLHGTKGRRTWKESAKSLNHFWRSWVVACDRTPEKIFFQWVARKPFHAISQWTISYGGSSYHAREWLWLIYKAIAAESLLQRNCKKQEIKSIKVNADLPQILSSLEVTFPKFKHFPNTLGDEESAKHTKDTFPGWNNISTR